MKTEQERSIMRVTQLFLFSDARMRVTVIYFLLMTIFYCENSHQAFTCNRNWKRYLSSKKHQGAIEYLFDICLQLNLELGKLIDLRMSIHSR